MAVLAYLLFYYTWENTTSPLTIQRTNQTTLSTKEKCYQMFVIKRRAFRDITFGFDDNGQLNIPNFFVSRFDDNYTFLNISIIYAGITCFVDRETIHFVSIPSGLMA